MDGGLVTNIALGVGIAVFSIGLWMGLIVLVRAIVPGSHHKHVVPGWVWLVGAIMAGVSYGPEASSGEKGGEWAVASDVTFFSIVIIAATLVVRAAARSGRRRGHPSPTAAQADPPWPATPSISPLPKPDTNGNHPPTQPSDGG